MADETKGMPAAPGGSTSPVHTNAAAPAAAQAPGGGAAQAAGAQGMAMNPAGGGNRGPAKTPEEEAADRSAPPRNPRKGSAARDRPPEPVQFDPMTLAVNVAAVQKAVAAHASSQLPTPDLDKTVPGGRYKVEGRWVNAHGRELEGDDLRAARDEADED